MEPDWNKVMEVLEYRVAHRRKYASAFEWHEQDQEEAFVMRDFVKTLKAKGESTFSNIKRFEPDPPDFIADAADGTTIAVELTEFVSAEAIRRAAKGKPVHVEWNDDQFFRNMEEIILKKDAKTFHGGSCSRVILLVYTDEYMVTPDMVERIFAAKHFGKARNITDAFLMMEAPPRLPKPGAPLERTCLIFKMQFE
jgi:hypothetical protein